MFALQEEAVTPSFEVLLVLGAIGFYLFDSAMLLYANELVFAETNGRWIFACPGSRWRLLGKNPYLPNPLTPDDPLFRVCWSVSEPSKRQEDQDALRHFIRALTPLRYMVFVLLMLLLIGLPLVLYRFGTGLGLFLLLGVIYLTITVMLIQTYRRREVLGLSGKVFAGLAFDSLACAPFALNMVRKITLRRSLVGDPISFAHKIFDADTFARLVNALCNRVDEELELEDEESSRCSELEAYRNRITGMVS